jgi:hypothetical protein
MKLTSDELVLGFATTAKVIEEISFRSAGKNLLRIRSTAGLQRGLGETLNSTMPPGHSSRAMAFPVRALGSILLGALQFGKVTVTRKETRRNIRIELPAGSLLLV